MAARNTPAGIRVTVYGRDKGKAGIEGLRVSIRLGQRISPGLDQAESKRLLGRFLAVADGQRLVDAHRLVADG